jgi:hypothetical protein
MNFKGGASLRMQVARSEIVHCLKDHTRQLMSSSSRTLQTSSDCPHMDFRGLQTVNGLGDSCSYHHEAASLAVQVSSSASVADAGPTVLYALDGEIVNAAVPRSTHTRCAVGCRIRQGVQSS